MENTLQLSNQDKILSSVYQNRQAFIVAFLGSSISVACYIIVQMDFWFREFSFSDHVQWQAWLVLGTGLLMTCIFSILLYARLGHERKVAEYAMQLEVSNRDLDSFAAIASHDLKEPLRTIQSYSELIMRREDISSKGKQYMDTICDASSHMQEILYHIRHYARIGAGVDSRDEIVSLDKVFDCVKVNLSHLIDERSALLISNELPQVMGSQIQIMQLLQNLITNSIRYCPADRVPEVSLVASEITDGWQFTLSDNGEGIPEEASEIIFEPFKRYSNQKVSGSGLGLSICRRIVEAHGGTICCEPRINEGTNFIFTIMEN